MYSIYLCYFISDFTASNISYHQSRLWTPSWTKNLFRDPLFHWAKNALNSTTLPSIIKKLQNLFLRHFNRRFTDIDRHVMLLRWLIRWLHAGKVTNQPRLRLLVHPLSDLDSYTPLMGKRQTLKQTDPLEFHVPFPDFPQTERSAPWWPQHPNQRIN